MPDSWTPSFIAHQFIDIMPRLGRLIARHLHANGNDEVTLMQGRTLMAIRQTAVTTSELAKQRKVSLQSASVLVQGLVDRGWVMRARDPHDRRRWVLCVTPEGEAQAQLAEKEMLQLFEQVISSLTDEELAAGQVFLKGLQHVLEKQTSREDAETSGALNEAVKTHTD